MLYINKNSTNEIKVTLTELTTIPVSGVTYLFELKSHTTNDIVYFIAENTSLNIAKYDKFSITETGSTYTNVLAGIVHLTEGDYTYNVYEQESTTNLDPANTNGNVVETGLLKVVCQSQITTVKESTTIKYKYA